MSYFVFIVGKFQYIRMIQFTLVADNPDTIILQQAIQEKVMNISKHHFIQFYGPYSRGDQKVCGNVL